MAGVELSPSPAESAEAALLTALRAGDERAFVELLDRHTGSMLRVARLIVATPDAAADVVQETWLAVLHGLDRFEARASLRTWIFRILVNRARSRRQRDGRTVSFSALAAQEAGAAGHLPDPAEFTDDPSSWPGHWRQDPRRWARSAEDEHLSAELRDAVREAIDALPLAQRTVIGLRDIEGWTQADICQLLEITPGNGRVLLHRARSRVRARLDGYLRDR